MWGLSIPLNGFPRGSAKMWMRLRSCSFNSIEWIQDRRPLSSPRAGALSIPLNGFLTGGGFTPVVGGCIGFQFH